MTPAEDFPAVPHTSNERPLVVALGEAMIRLSPPGRTPLRFASSLEVAVAGSEYNFLVTAVALGARGRFLTRLPANELGVVVRRHARANEIELLAAEEENSRAGLFFVESGAPPRATSVIYDRRDTAVTHLTADEFPWATVLDGAAAAHVSGITCALGAGPRAAVRAFLGAARDAGVMTSFDVNYRSQLWSTDDARREMRAVLPLVDTLFLSSSDFALLLEGGPVDDGAADRLVEEFGVTTIVIRDRCPTPPGELGVRVRVHGLSVSPAESIGVAVDEVGAGDAAAGAFVAAIVEGEETAVAVERAARAYARMVTIPGDTWSGSLVDLSDGYVARRTVVR